MPYRQLLGQTRHHFPDLRTVFAKATPARSGDTLAGLAAASEEERMAARFCLADLPLTAVLREPLLQAGRDEVSDLIERQFDAQAFAAIGGLTFGEFRDFLLSADAARIEAVRPGITPEMAAGVSKLMRNLDLISVARKLEVVRRFRSTVGLRGRLSGRNQPNDPMDSSFGIAASAIDGLLMGSGDAVIGVNPVSDRLDDYIRVCRLLDDLRRQLDIPSQTCVLGHVTTSIRAIEAGAPVDLVFQSIAGSEQANRAFGISLSLLHEAQEAARALGRGTVGQDVMYFETGQGSALSSGAHFGVDQQTMEARAYAVARDFDCLLVNTVVGFIGPEYLFDGKQIMRAGLEDHFCGKLLGLPMGVDVCYTNHAQADQDDMDTLLTLLCAAGVNFVISVPGSDDVMLNYQSLSHHDLAMARQINGLGPAPEFELWLERMDRDGARALAPARRMLEAL